MDSNQNIILALADKGYAVVDHFLPGDIYYSIKQYAMSLEKQNEFDKAGIGKNDQHQIQSEIRGDWVYWLNKNDIQKGIQYYLKTIEALRLLINYNLFLNLFDFETHFAVYPAGKFYVRHKDQFQGNDIRQISLVLFLNDDWVSPHHGELCIYTDNKKHVIEPIANRLVCFRSALEHEVLPTTTKRYSLTGWLRKQSVPFVD